MTLGERVEQNAVARRDVTIVVPALNEEATIEGVVSACVRLATTVIVVDGRSTDDTRSLAAAAGATCISDNGRGKGDAIRTVVPRITTELTVFIDADGSHAPDDISRLLAPIDENRADHVAASRLIGGSSELHGGFDEFFRLTGSAFITACINRRLGVRLSDSQNGFRAIRTSLLKRLPLREDLTTIEQEMTIKTLQLGYRLLEVPSHEYARQAGRSHIRIWRTAPRYVYSLVKYLYVCPARRSSVPPRARTG